MEKKQRPVLYIVGESTYFASAKFLRNVPSKTVWRHYFAVGYMFTWDHPTTYEFTKGPSLSRKSF